MDRRPVEILHRAALLLLARARRRGGFLVDAGQLSDELSELETHIKGITLVSSDHASSLTAPADFVVEVRPESADRLQLECRYDQSAVLANIRFDGVLEEEASGFAVGFDGSDTNIGPNSRKQDEAPSFEGTEFGRALAAGPQPGSAIIILAAELYGDGVVIHYQHDPAADVVPATSAVTLADDVGTPYQWTGAEVAGLRVRRGSARFIPAVPDNATELRVYTEVRCVGFSLN